MNVARIHVLIQEIIKYSQLVIKVLVFVDGVLADHLSIT